jgi:T5SS/PEP-CTERM-associated repeat protein
VQDGGKVSSRFGVLGSYTGSTGTANITGANSTWTNSEVLFIGSLTDFSSSGRGTLNVQDGGHVSNTGCLIGWGVGAFGAVTVTGANSTWTNNGSLRFGWGGRGTLNVQDGGKVNNTDADFSFGCTVTVTGTNSTWINNGSLSILNGSGNTLTIESGGTVEVTGTTSVGYSNNVINLKPGGTLKTAALNLDNNASRLNWTGGTLSLGGGAASALGGAGLSVPGTGTLAGTGTIAGSVNNAGTIAPGNSPGLLAITGNLSTTGTLAMELAGTARGTGYDALNVTGTLTPAARWT